MLPLSVGRGGKDFVDTIETRSSGFRVLMTKNLKIFTAEKNYNLPISRSQ
jgi:hypothetical protein